MRKIYRRIFWAGLVALAAALLIGTTALADHPDPVPIEDVRFDQKLNAPIPQELRFQDEQGNPVQLAHYFGEKPVVLVMGYLNCPMLCPMVMEDFAHTLQGLTWTPGRQFEVVMVSIDPKEGPDLAAEKKALYLSDYGRPEAEAGWHFLTGQQPEISALSDAVGFHAVYDENTGEYAHPAGIIIATPEGRVSRYLFGIDYKPLELRMGLVEASANKIGTLVDQFYLLCYHYDPVSGRYNLIIQNVLQIAGLATVLVLGGGIFLLAREGRVGGGPSASPQG